MTLQSRLSKLERRTRSTSAGQCWEADLDAHLWREVNSGQAGQPLSEGEAHLAYEGGGLLLIGGKYLVGIDGAAL